MKPSKEKMPASHPMPAAHQASQPFWRKAEASPFFSKEAPRQDFFFGSNAAGLPGQVIQPKSSANGMEEPLQKSEGKAIRAQWSDSPKTGAASATVAPPSGAGWNDAEHPVGDIRRIPIENLKEGNQEEALNPAADKQSAAGRAIVLLPASPAIRDYVEKLFKLAQALARSTCDTGF